ncbi:Auxin-induced protein 5NG4 [Hordeum vulgare]|nr:Auxin-induced protein 5NG4 [Hordeum vulgare]
MSGSRRKTSEWLEQFGAETEETVAGVTGTEEIAVEVHTVETEEIDQTKSAIEFHEMFNIVEPRLGGTGILVRFRNPYDAYHLLGRVWFGVCEFICFTTYNIFTDLDSIWANEHAMHTLPYNLPTADDEE